VIYTPSLRNWDRSQTPFPEANASGTVESAVRLAVSTEGPVRLYIMRRFLNMIPTLIGLSLIVFLLMRVIPGDATDLILEESPTAQRKDELRAELGLDRPLHEQYLVWIGGVVRGDFGTSFWTNKPVIDGIKRTTPVTVELAFFAS